MSDWSEIADAVRAYEAQLRAIPLPAGPTAFPPQLATTPDFATGPAPINSAHTALSPAINANTPRAGASYNGDDA